MAGIHYTQIGSYENKGAQPSADILAKLANALGVSSDLPMVPLMSWPKTLIDAFITSVEYSS